MDIFKSKKSIDTVTANRSIKQAKESLHRPSALRQKEERYLKKLSLQTEQEESWWNIKYVFQPESSSRMVWDMIMLTFILYLSLTVPFFICFNDTPSNSTIMFEFIMNICFMADILLSFNTGFYLKGTLIMNRKEIIKDYLRRWFWMDLVASLPYAWFVTGAFESDSNSTAYKAPKVLRLMRVFRFLKVLRLLRLAKLKRILVRIEDYIASNVLASIFVFTKLLALVFFIAHWTACLWFFIGDTGQESHPVTWVTYANLQDRPVLEKYITSLYWALTTMSTVGYGDITPFTIIEKIYAMTTMIMASGVFAFTIGSIGALVSKANAVENAYREQVIAVNRYMRRKSLEKNLQFRVRRYLDYVWENKKKNKLDEKQVLILLSEPLRDEIYSHIHGVVIHYCKIFDKFEANFISQLARTLMNETFAPGDNIIEEGEMSDKLYFIMTGKVIIYHGITKSLIKELKEKDYFGEISFFSGNPRCASVKCTDFVDVLSLTKINFSSLIEKFPEASATNDILTKACERGEFAAINISCYICDDLGHYSTKCKTLLVNLDQEETRTKWMKLRNFSESRLINILDDKVSFHRKPKKAIAMRYGARNIVGVPRNTIRLYDTGERAFPQVVETPEPVLESSTGDSVDNYRTNARPIYSELYVNTEESPLSAQSRVVDEQNIRAAAFRLSLIKKDFIEDPRFSRVNSLHK